MLKELLYTGVGVAAVLKEKVEDEVKKLEEQGKIKTSDAKSFLESVEARGKEEEEKFKEQLKPVIKDILDELGVATKEDLQKLKEDLK